MLVLIMLLKLSIILWSNASEFCLLCSIYAPYVKYYTLQIQYFISLILLKLQNYSISSLSSSSTVQYTINNLSIYLYQHFEFIFVTFATLVNAYFDKIITTDSPKSNNPVKSVHFTQILSIVLATFAYYAGIMLNAVAFLSCSKLCWHNRLKPLTGKDWGMHSTFNVTLFTY